jgi:hypothetical protein
VFTAFNKLRACGQAKKKPEQAACKSYPQAFLAPILLAKMLAVAGKTISGCGSAKNDKVEFIGTYAAFF